MAAIILCLAHADMRLKLCMRVRAPVCAACGTALLGACIAHRAPNRSRSVAPRVWLRPASLWSRTWQAPACTARPTYRMHETVRACHVLPSRTAPPWHRCMHEDTFAVPLRGPCARCLSRFTSGRNSTKRCMHARLNQRMRRRMVCVLLQCTTCSAGNAEQAPLTHTLKQSALMQLKTLWSPCGLTCSPLCARAAMFLARSARVMKWLRSCASSCQEGHPSASAVWRVACRDTKWSVWQSAASDACSVTPSRDELGTKWLA